MSVNCHADVFGENFGDIVFPGVVDYGSGDIIVMDDEISVSRLEVAIEYVLERSAEWIAYRGHPWGHRSAAETRCHPRTDGDDLVFSVPGIPTSGIVLVDHDRDPGVG